MQGRPRCLPAPPALPPGHNPCALFCTACVPPYEPHESQPTIQLQDPATRTSLLDGAISRLASAAAFTRGDVDPLVALGDALTARAGEVYLSGACLYYYAHASMRVHRRSVHM